jgi:hypothetical protein
MVGKFPDAIAQYQKALTQNPKFLPAIHKYWV